MNNRIYLDNAATTPLDSEVLENMIHIMREFYGNPSSTHAHGRKVKGLLEEARGKIAKSLHCLPSEIFFTSGGTEADNLAIRSCVKTLGVTNIISSPIEHHAVLHTIEELANEGKINRHMVKINKNGHVDLNDLQDLLNQTGPNTLVSLMHANNEIGNMIDIKKVGEMVHHASGLFHCDTVQTMGHFPFNLGEGYVDFLAAGAHKFNGPKGVGFIYINKKNKLKPEITGGSQEREMRGGTENVYGIVGMAHALEVCYRDLEKKHEHILGIKHFMKEQLIQHIPNVEFNGDVDGESLYTVLSVSLPASEAGNMLLFNLDIAGISASTGSACSSGSNVGSHVINAIHPGTDRTTIRFSFGKYNTKEDIEKTVSTLKAWYNSAIPA